MMFITEKLQNLRQTRHNYIIFFSSSLLHVYFINSNQQSRFDFLDFFSLDT